MSWQSKSELHTEFSRLAPARVVLALWSGPQSFASRTKLLAKATLSGLTASFACQLRTSSCVSRLVALQRAASIFSSWILPVGGTRHVAGSGPRWQRHVMMRLAPLALRMNSLCSHPKAGAKTSTEAPVGERPSVLALMCTDSSGQGRGCTDTHGSADMSSPPSGVTGLDIYVAETRLTSPVRFEPTFLFSAIRLLTYSFGPYPDL